MIIDLRSDTVTRPTVGMLQTMMHAEVGDDVYKEDSTVIALQERIATLFGKPKALFFPSGTMANQTAIKVHTQPGDQIICSKDAHIYNFEGGGTSFNSGVSCKLINGYRGMFTADQVKTAINPFDLGHSPKTAMVAVENTANLGGGACWDIEVLKEIGKICKTNNLKYHLDGARLWNALKARRYTALEYGKIFDTISVCLSKGLGCPAGSMLIGDEGVIDEAFRIRKILGGGMRQVGYLAAAGLYALDRHLDRLMEDHQRAKEIEAVLFELSFIKTIYPVETNIIIFEVNGPSEETHFLTALIKQGVLIGKVGINRLRIVTHINYTKAMHLLLLKTLKSKSLFQ